jgi:hypothetical protein
MRRLVFVIVFLVAVPLTAATRGIQNIKIFLDQCPTKDPAFGEIMLDFEIRRDGRPTTVPFCSEPVSAMGVREYTDELIVLQALRVMYYMDRGMSGHLPWTSMTLYDWMKTKIRGIDIITGGGAACCETINGKTFIFVGSQDDLNREGHKTWIGIAGDITLYAHEARHVDDFPHSSCCGIPGGCDDAFDTANLSAYAVPWWLFSLWLSGTINVGYACLTPSEAAEATGLFLQAMNSLRDRFCTTKPALVSPPRLPGGPCSTTSRRRVVRR